MPLVLSMNKGMQEATNSVNFAEQGIQHKSDINAIFCEFIEEESKQLTERLNAIWTKQRPKNWASKTEKYQSWDEIKNWDRTVPCPNETCNHNIERPLPRTIGIFGIVQRIFSNPLLIILMRSWFQNHHCEPPIQ